MNDEQKKTIPQLLSAYVDGELTADERVEVEHVLETSDAARRELNELQRLSTLLQQLPHATAPVDLSSAVLEQARAKSASHKPAAVTPSDSFLSTRLKFVCGLAATAVALFLLTFFLPRFGDNSSPVASDEMSSSGQPEEVATLRTKAATGFLNSENMSKSLEYQAGEFDRTADDANTMKRKVAEHQDFAKGGGGKGGSFGEETPSVSALGMTPGQARMSVRSQQRQTNFRDIDWDGVNVGDILSYEDKSGEQVAIIQVTVVDIHQAIDKMQLLLAKNSIPDVTFKADVEEKTTGKPAANSSMLFSSSIPAQQVGLLVETSNGQLATTFNQMRDSRLFLDLQPQSYVSIEGVQTANVDKNGQLAEVSENIRLNYQRKLKEAEQLIGNKDKADPKTRAKQPANLPAKTNARTTSKAPAPSGALKQKKTTAADKSSKPRSVQPALAAPVEAEKSAEGKDDDAVVNSYQLLLNIDRPKLAVSSDKYALKNSIAPRDNYFFEQSKSDTNAKPGKSETGKQQGLPKLLSGGRDAVNNDSIASQKIASPKQGEGYKQPGKEGRTERKKQWDRPQVDSKLNRLQQNGVRVLFVFKQDAAPVKSKPIQKARTP